MLISMFTLYEQGDEFQRIAGELRKRVMQLVERLAIRPERKDYPQECSLYEDPGESQYLHIIEDGFLKVEYRNVGERGRLLYFLEEGDLLGLSRALCGAPLSVTSEYRYILKRYPREEFLSAVHQSPETLKLWEEIIGDSFALSTRLLAHFVKPELRSEPETRLIPTGNPIIIQDTEPYEVFILLRGAADVFFNDVKVGEVLSGEIFGAIAPTGNIRRTASVIARTPTLVLVLPKNQFLALVETHPQTVYKLLEDMSRIITDQNIRLVDLQTEKT